MIFTAQEGGDVREHIIPPLHTTCINDVDSTSLRRRHLSGLWLKTKYSLSFFALCKDSKTILHTCIHAFSRPIGLYYTANIEEPFVLRVHIGLVQ